MMSAGILQSCSSSSIEDESTKKNKISSVLIARTTTVDIEGIENYPQGCAFSPDGLCILTATVGDSKLRLYNTPSSLFRSRSTDGTSIEKESDDTKNASICLAAPVDLPVDESNPAKTKITSNGPEVTTSVVEDWKVEVTALAGDSVRSYSWFPLMSSQDPASCCFAAVSRCQPIHLFDAYTGAVRASYTPINALDELESPMIVQFSPDGQRIISSGFRTDRSIFCFDVHRPGKDATNVYKLGKTKRSSDGQKGYVSTMAFQSGISNNNRIFAVGTYSPGSIYVYDDRINGERQQPVGTIFSGTCIVGHGKKGSRKRKYCHSSEQADENEIVDKDQETSSGNENWLSSAKTKWFRTKTAGGVSQVNFLPTSEYFLYSTSRRSNTILSWDLRMLSGNIEYQFNPIRGIGSFETNNDTNQRIEFEFDKVNGQTLYVGGQDSCVRIYDVSTGTLKGKIEGFQNTVNGVSTMNGFQSGTTFLAVASGSRTFDPEEDSGSEDNSTDACAMKAIQGSLSLYALPG